MSNNLPNTLIDNNSEIVTPPWAVPALEVLEQMLEKRRENLRKRNGDENQAAVTRDEFLEHLHDLKGMTLWHASDLVSSLKRAGVIKCFGRFIQMAEQVEK